MPRDIKIHPVLNGFVCTVGCQHVVFTNVMDMAKAINEYYHNPTEVEARWIANKVNNTLSTPEVPGPSPYGPVPPPGEPICNQVPPPAPSTAIGGR